MLEHGFGPVQLPHYNILHRLMVDTMCGGYVSHQGFAVCPPVLAMAIKSTFLAAIRDGSRLRLILTSVSQMMQTTCSSLVRSVRMFVLDRLPHVTQYRFLDLT